MNFEYKLTAVLIAAVITFALRALPFVIFGGERRMPDKLVKLGQMLPAAIMAILVVYCVKDILPSPVKVGVPKVIAVLFVALSYKWKHNTFVSIAVGTALYMVLQYGMGVLG